jgi:hypothetical protein
LNAFDSYSAHCKIFQFNRDEGDTGDNDKKPRSKLLPPLKNGIDLFTAAEIEGA